MMAGQFSHSGNHGGVRGRAVGAWCKATGFGASVSTVWGGNLDLVSRQVAQTWEDGVGRVEAFLLCRKMLTVANCQPRLL